MYITNSFHKQQTDTKLTNETDATPTNDDLYETDFTYLSVTEESLLQNKQIKLILQQTFPATER